MSISDHIGDTVDHHLFDVVIRQGALDAKAAAIGAGPQRGDTEAVPSQPGAFVAHHDGLDVYVGLDGAAFEVHGDIRVKYDAMGGPASLLGLPVTDETGTPDGLGRFNHFAGGSIYWAPHTGPMCVHGRVRDRWAADGWERGRLGYPVRDQRRMATTGAAPETEWCVFENGLVASDPTHAMVAPAALQNAAELHTATFEPALLTYQQLGDLFGARLNAQFKASPDNVAMRPGVELTGVTPWTYDVWAPKPRTVGFRFRGFHDNGLATDTDFHIDISVALELVWTATFGEPTHKTLVARLTFLRVVFEGGLPLGAVIDGVRNGVHDGFQGPDPAHPEVPTGSVFLAGVDTHADADTGAIDVIDLQVTAEGGLQVLVNPLPPPGAVDDTTTSWAAVRQFFVQNVLNVLVDP